MESGKIINSQISASSEWASGHGAANGRLNFQRPNNAHAWIPQTAPDSWLQVEFRHVAVITRVLTQGRGNYPQWVVLFTLSYSNDVINFISYLRNGVEKVIELLTYCYL
jgi:hypothetical protein